MKDQDRGAVTQRIEDGPSKPVVEGSIPSSLTTTWCISTPSEDRINSLRSFMIPLSDRLRDWSDVDWVMYQVGICQGEFPEGTAEDEAERFRLEFKHIFWSNNPAGDKLYAKIAYLIEKGILEYNALRDQYRWKQ
jgi:hypothetical protein